ncbi:aspartate aminotransferase family protein [Acrocarpospora macrocephala]|uniref:Putative aminotransferase YhxA n=1 Tax=Acrocarpospora macrocephala TaxID=150177 RepID=A0A5M3X7C6_9ACTN|nr:aminotransferase class III-fold pyridoxal phosphate-dependent enzyme [Acrocarpospora macrocephala]GES14763.1 putative aminotransferase YhxA [Acrocarpospora macrocephala]
MSYVHPMWHHSVLAPEHAPAPVVLERAEGVYLWDREGNRYIDGLASFGACIVGHGRPELAQAAYDQMSSGAHLAPVFGCTNDVSRRLAERLLALTGHSGGSVRFATSGSEAVEAAFRIALNYHLNRGDTERRIILATEGSYHGTTVATLAAAGRGENRHFMRDLDDMFVRLPATPQQEEAASAEFLEALRSTIERVGPHRIAAFVAEPIPVSFGIRIPHHDHWRKVKELLHEHGILYIADEVLNGFGRTGELFAEQHFGVTGDLITMSKGLSSGYFPISACVASAAVTAAFDEYGERALRHMGTYSAHAAGCAVAMRTIDIIEDEALVENARIQGARVGAGLTALAAEFPGRVHPPTGLGLFWTVVLNPDGDRQLAREVLAECRARGMITQANGNVLYFYLPLVVTAEEVDESLVILSESFRAVLK